MADDHGASSSSSDSEVSTASTSLSAMSRSSSRLGTSYGKIADFPKEVQVEALLQGVSLDHKDQASLSERIDASQRVKAVANQYVGKGSFAPAAALYTLALDLYDKDAVYYTNRALCHIKLESYGLAIQDATDALRLDGRNVKAYYRRAMAQLALARPQKAVPDLKKVMAIEPANKTAQAELTAAQALARRLAFVKAIEREDEEAIGEKLLLEVDGMKDDDRLEQESLAGPRLKRATKEAVEAALEERRQIRRQESELSPKQKISNLKPWWPRDTTGPIIGNCCPPDPAFFASMQSWFKDGKQLDRKTVLSIVLGVREILRRERTMLEIEVEEHDKVTVVGDTHGQYYDFLNLLKLATEPTSHHFIVFNGDFVDRGSWSTEIALTIFAMKWAYPGRVAINRGNHETDNMNSVYGFEGEVKAKYNPSLFRLFSETFAYLPLATLVSGTEKVGSGGVKRYFITHGGLFSKDDVTLDHVRFFDRFANPQPSEGLAQELLWTDPQDEPGRGPSKRGVGLQFGPDVTKRWCDANSVEAVIRSHEVRQGGYSVEHNGKCITVFSAPNYCDAVGNKGAYIIIDSRGVLDFHTYDAVPHPNIKPMAYASQFGGVV